MIVIANTRLFKPEMIRNIFKNLTKRAHLLKTLVLPPSVEIREGRTKKGVAEYEYPTNIIIIDTNWAKFYSRVYKKSPQFVKKELTKVLGHEFAHMLVQSKYPNLTQYQDEVAAYKVMKLLGIPTREPATDFDRAALAEAENWWRMRRG